MGQQGSGLGQVTEREIALLMSTIASLNIRQSPSQLRAALKKVSKHFRSVQDKWTRMMEEAGYSPTETGTFDPETDEDREIGRMIDEIMLDPEALEDEGGY